MKSQREETLLQNQISDQKARLEARMRKLAAGDICLAFSGGVDSSLLLKAAVDAAEETGKKVYAVTFDSRLHPACDLEIAGQVAKELGGIHQVIQIDELEQADIRMNPENRCYLCKRRLFSCLKEFAEERKITCILDGTNEDGGSGAPPGGASISTLAAGAAAGAPAVDGTLGGLVPGGGGDRDLNQVAGGIHVGDHAVLGDGQGRLVTAGPGHCGVGRVHLDHEFKCLVGLEGDVGLVQRQAGHSHRLGIRLGIGLL